MNTPLTPPCANVYWYKTNTILRVEYFDLSVSLEKAQQHLSLIHQNFITNNTPVLCISRASMADINTKQRKISREVRTYLASEALQTVFKASALIVSNAWESLLGNLYLTASKPLIPTKLFKNEEKAVLWLEQLDI